MDEPPGDFESFGVLAEQTPTTRLSPRGPDALRLRIPLRLGRFRVLVRPFLILLAALAGGFVRPAEAADVSYQSDQVIPPPALAGSIPGLGTTIHPSMASVGRLPAAASFVEAVNADAYLNFSRPGSAAHVTDVWQWQLLPVGIIYHPYMANVHESRISGVVFGDDDQSILDVSLGGRVGLLRYGTLDSLRPEGWQIDLEGAAFPRLGLDHNWDVEATDFRFGVPLSYAIGNYQYKFSYYHLSSHLGDEFAIRNSGTLAERINYSRDALVLGASWYPLPAWRLYAEADWAFHFDDGNRPWEFLFGIDYAQPGPTGIFGTPFFAVNGHIRESVDFGGNFVVQTGWLWRGVSGHTVRMGFHYYNGKSSQFEFFDDFEQQIGFGIWIDQ